LPEETIDPLLLSHLCIYSEPLLLRRDGKPVHWTDEARHRAAFASDPEFYALSAFTEGIHPWQQARILLLLLSESRGDFPLALRAICERITLFLLATLPTELVLTVFLAARRARANHRHTARAILSYLLQHPTIEALLCARPGAIRDCLEHALGKVQARTFGYYAPRAGQDLPLPALLRRYGGTETQIRRLFAALYFGAGEQTGNCAPPIASLDRQPAPADVLVPLLQQFYRVGTSPALVQQLEAAVAGRSAELPTLPGKIALILDASASMRGGRRQEFTPMALAVAFERVLRVKCPQLRPYNIGGFGWPPAPEGPTDFGRVLIDALEGSPDLVVFVTDGFENQNPGDTACILATVRTMGLLTPVICCRIESDLSETAPYEAHGTEIPAFPLREEGDFRVALQTLNLLATPQTARESIVNDLRTRQERWETEVYGWTAAS
jgi:hypothetical protein